MGLGAVPGRQAAFREGLEQAVLYAKALGCPRYPPLPTARPFPSVTPGRGSRARAHWPFPAPSVPVS